VAIASGGYNGEYNSGGCKAKKHPSKKAISIARRSPFYLESQQAYLRFRETSLVISNMLNLLLASELLLTVPEKS
jgi:hypothetical protein